MLKAEKNIYSFRKENQVNKHVVMDKYQCVDGCVDERRKALILVCVGGMLVVR